ncbi:MAG: hypothetical protein AAFY26_21045 [Cyanobacteria bacterium J06638_22]
MFALVITKNAGTILECHPSAGVTIFNSSDSSLFTVRFFFNQKEAIAHFREHHDGDLEIRLGKQVKIANRTSESVNY